MFPCLPGLEKYVQEFKLALSALGKQLSQGQLIISACLCLHTYLFLLNHNLGIRLLTHMYTILHEQGLNSPVLESVEVLASQSQARRSIQKRPTENDLFRYTSKCKDSD